MSARTFRDLLIGVAEATDWLNLTAGEVEAVTFLGPEHRPQIRIKVAALLRQAADGGPPANCIVTRDGAAVYDLHRNGLALVAVALPGELPVEAS